MNAKTAAVFFFSLVAANTLRAGDFIESWWKALYAPKWISEAYAAQDDYDRDGWGAWDERRAGTMPDADTAVSQDGRLMADHPMPETMLTLQDDYSCSGKVHVLFRPWRSPIGDHSNLNDETREVVLEGGRHSYSIYLSCKGGDLANDVVALGGGTVLPATVEISFYGASERVGNSILDRRVTLNDGVLYYGTTPVGKVHYPSGTCRVDWDSVATASGGVVSVDPDKPTYATVCWASLQDVNTRLKRCAGRSNPFKSSSAFAYCDENGNGKYDLGEPYGTEKHGSDFHWENETVKVPQPFGDFENEYGWAGKETKIGLTRTKALFAAVDLRTGKTDREVVYGSLYDGATNYYGAAFTNGMVVPVRVFRAMVDHEHESLSSLRNRMILSRTFDVTRRTFLHEGDFLRDGEFDLDWSTFDEIKENMLVEDYGLPITSMVYRVYAGEGAVKILDTTYYTNVIDTLTEFIEVERRYELTRTTPTIVSPAGNYVYNARPVFKWNMNGECDWAAKFGSSYTAFRIGVWRVDEEYELWDSGIQFVPPVGLDGTYTWEAPLSVGQMMTNGTFFSNGEYEWKVITLNAKFQSGWNPHKNALGTKWSQSKRFTVCANADSAMNDHGYGSLSATVKYAGTNAVSAAGVTNAVQVWVGRYPDFRAGMESVCTATDVSGIASGTVVTVKGLPMNETVYACAWIDVNGNYRRDDDEPWGYHHYDGNWNPKGVAIEGDTAPSASILIED